MNGVTRGAAVQLRLSPRKIPKLKREEVVGSPGKMRELSNARNANRGNNVCMLRAPARVGGEQWRENAETIINVLRACLCSHFAYLVLLERGKMALQGREVGDYSS